MQALSFRGRCATCIPSRVANRQHVLVVKASASPDTEQPSTSGRSDAAGAAPAAAARQQGAPAAARPGRPTPGRPGMAPGRPLTPPPKPGMVLSPEGEWVEMVRLNDRPDAFSGIAAVDRGENDAPSNPGRVALLAAGDLAVLLAFAATGRVNHGEPLTLADTIATALPFIIGWFSAGAALGGFGPAAQGGNTPAAAAAAATTWAAGVPLGIVLRSIGRGYVPATSFMLVAMGATGVLMVGWRAALAAATPQAEELTPAQRAARRTNKSGNIFEGLQMIMSLVKRW